MQSEKATAVQSSASKTSKNFWDDTPGPGSYNPRALKSNQENRAGFKSRTLRKFMKLKKNPPPNRYRISRALIKKKPFKHRGGTSSFARPAKKKKRDMIEGFLKYRKIKKDKGVPGPGTYLLNDQFKPPLFPIDEKRGTGNFKEGKVDRFGDFKGKRLKSKKSKPGPGQYFKQGK